MNSPYLLTPGPLTTSDTVKQAMLRDWGSRDPAFIAMNREVRRAPGRAWREPRPPTCACHSKDRGPSPSRRPSGLWCRGDGKLLVLVNGAYGTRMVRDRRA